MSLTGLSAGQDPCFEYIYVHNLEHTLSHTEQNTATAYAFECCCCRVCIIRKSPLQLLSSHHRPVDHVPEGADVLGPAVLVLEVVGVLPHVQAEDGDHGRAGCALH